MIISQSKDSFEGEVLVGVFDDNSFTLIGFFVFVMIGFIWIAIQLEKYNNLTPEQPTLMQVKPSDSMTDYVISMGLTLSLLDITSVYICRIILNAQVLFLPAYLTQAFSFILRMPKWMRAHSK